MIFTTKKLDPRYNNSSIFNIALFALNTAAATLYLALMEYTAYFVNGIIGFTVVFTSIVLTALRVFDGLIDPIIGYIVDRTQGKFGKFRPFMVGGNLLMAVSSLLLFNFSHMVPKWFRLPVFVVIYVVFVIGYTFQMLTAKAGQTVMTNNPKIRPISTYFDSLFITSSYGGIALYVQTFLTKKYEGSYRNPMLYKELTMWVVIISGLCTVLAVIGIWKKDRQEFFGTEGEPVKVHAKDYINVIKHNKPIRMLVTAASVNKFTSMVYSNITVGVIIFGIMMKNYELSGTIGLVTAIPNLIVVTIGVIVAQRLGQKKAFQTFTWFAIAFQIIMTGLLMFGELTKVGFNLNAISIGFFLIFILLNGSKSVSNNIVVPMIADCSDYEVFRSGLYVPGLMGALFSLIDQVVSAFGTAFVGVVVAMIGFKEHLPQVDDALTPKLKLVAIICYCIVPIVGWLTSLYSMKFYELDKEKMREINYSKFACTTKQHNEG
ncbi:MAG: MFS transporter [Clostridiales bacterium]|nr:MFS transporter [Clostridiales bacterium]